MMTDWMYSWPAKMAMFSAMRVLAVRAQTCTSINKMRGPADLKQSSLFDWCT